MRERTVIVAGAGLWVLAMFAFGLPHAIWRHFHVDEIQIAYNVAQWGVLDQGADHTNYAAPFMVPLSWFIGGMDASANMLLVLRSCFFLVFCACLVGVALLQPYFKSATGKLLVLFGVSMFHPFWLHGFEIRHDTLLVAGSIGLYGVAQYVAARDESPYWIYLIGGAVAGTMQANAFKAFLYWLPFCALIATIAVWKLRKSKGRIDVRPALFMLAGFAAAIAVAVVLLLIAGRLDVYLSGMTGAIGTSKSAYQFSAKEGLKGLVLGSPLVFAGAALFIVLATLDAVRQRMRIELRTAVTAAFLVWNLIVLVLNPVPFSYNFIHMTPFAFLAALDLLSRIELANDESKRIGIAVALAASLFLFGQNWKFHYYSKQTNETQLAYIAAAEALTSTNDTVLDGVGLVLSRKAPDKHWMLHSLTMPNYKAGKRTSFFDMVMTKPSPVAIASYRWTWLSKRDRKAIASRYIQLYPKFFVLGSRLSARDGALSIHYPGRYLVRTRTPVPQLAMMIDDKPLPPTRVVDLAAGKHRFANAIPGNTIVHWIGPKLDAPPDIKGLKPKQPLFTTD